MATTSQQQALTRHYVAEWLDFCGWPQERLAEALGVNPSTVSRYVKNKRGLGIMTLGKIAQVLGVEPADLLEDPAVFSPSRALRQLSRDQQELVAQTIRLLQSKS